MGTKKSTILHWFQIRRQNWKKLHDKKVISQKYAFWFLINNFFTISSLDLELAWNSAFFGTHIDLYEEKSFLLYFVTNMNCVSQVYTPLFCGSCLGGGNALHTCAELLGRMGTRKDASLFYVNCVLIILINLKC